MTEPKQATRVVDDIRTFFDTTQADPEALRGERLCVVADRRRILAADPPSIVVSWFVDPSAKGVRAAACQYGHFFGSPESAAAWVTRYPQGGVLSLDEAMEAARRSAVADFGVTP